MSEEKGVSQQTKGKIEQVKSEAIDKTIIDVIVKTAVEEAQLLGAEEAVDYFIDRIRSMDFSLLKQINAHLKARIVPSTSK
jgi:hypothetical protein